MNTEDAFGLLYYTTEVFITATLGLALLVWLFGKIKDVVGEV